MTDFLPQKNLKLIVPKPQETIKSYLERCKENVEPKEGSLDIRWWKGKDRRKRYAICCSCGNIRLLKAQNGLRCHLCNSFHSWSEWNRLRVKVHALARFGSDLILKIEQDSSKSQILDKEIF